MVKAEIFEGQEQVIEATGDAWVIADAIRNGFAELAESIRVAAKIIGGEVDDVAVQPARYMDGTPIE